MVLVCWAMATTLVPRAHALWSSTTGVSKPVTERLSVSNAVLPGCGRPAPLHHPSRAHCLDETWLSDRCS